MKIVESGATASVTLGSEDSAEDSAASLLAPVLGISLLFNLLVILRCVDSRYL